MNVSNQEQKQVRLKRFLSILSEDPALLDRERPEQPQSLSELLNYTGYTPRNEPVDMAELFSRLLKKKGLQACSEDLMEFIMNGGTVDDFMNSGNRSLAKKN